MEAIEAEPRWFWALRLLGQCWELPLFDCASFGAHEHPTGQREVTVLSHSAEVDRRDEATLGRVAPERRSQASRVPHVDAAADRSEDHVIGRPEVANTWVAPGTQHFAAHM